MTEIQEKLFALQDVGYKAFQSKLMPTIDPDTIIGVRSPAQKALAKELFGTPLAEEFLRTLPHTYYEENNLHGLLIMREKNYDTVLAQLEDFLPCIDNWATCDTLRPNVFAKHKAELLGEIRKWLVSDHAYTVRFAIEMLMTFYLDEDFFPEALELVAAVDWEEYYVKMMVAWYFATALAKQYEAALPYVEQGRLERWTHNKTIQKAVESYRITDEQKAYLKTFRRK